MDTDAVSLAVIKQSLNERRVELRDKDTCDRSRYKNADCLFA